MKSIITRYEKNPILKPEDMPFDCFAVYNGGAIKIGDEYIVMTRAEDATRKSHAWVVRGTDGMNFTPDPEPVKFVAEDMEKYQEYAAKAWYDPRINLVENDGEKEYFITYAAAGKYGCRVGLGKTTDFKVVEHISFPLHIQNRNGVLFPEKIDGMYVMLHRPESSAGGAMWISRSPDLKFWGDTEVVTSHQSGLWDSLKIGAGAPPIKTDAGWLVIIHAVCGNCAGHYYTMGTVLLDLDNPYKMLGRSKGCVMRPEANYEQTGFVPNVIFPTGAILEDDGQVKIYYGTADNYECMAMASIDELVQTCF